MSLFKNLIGYIVIGCICISNTIFASNEIVKPIPKTPTTVSTNTNSQSTTPTVNNTNNEPALSASERQGGPMQMLDQFAGKVNKDDRIQDTAVNDITDIQGQYSAEFKISNTLDSIRLQITPYLQWVLYLGLSLAVLAIIYNGFLMVTNVMHGNGDNTKVKSRLINIAIGVGLLTGFYVVIQLLLAIISYITK